MPITVKTGKKEKKEISLISDRKIQDGNDTRTYKVSFEKVHKQLKGFNCKWNLKDGVKKLLDDLKRMEINENIFYSYEFYRLQKIENLYEKGKIDKNLNWRD